MAVGDQISFVINAGTHHDNGCDGTLFNPSITYTATGGGKGPVLHYVLTDLQGSVRAVMNNNGVGTSSVIARHDYLPFGEEIGAGVGMRTGTQGYNVPDSNRQKYAMLERDGTGLDHTWWRKYESTAGRWTSPDPMSGSIGDPQSFNHYSYTRNDPVNFVDPSGLLDSWNCQFTSTGWQCGMTIPISWADQLSAMTGGPPEFNSPVMRSVDPFRPQNTGEDYEFAHSRVRCPPTGNQLAKNPVVKKGLQKALDLSKSSGVERGGWIYWNKKTGSIFTIIKDPPTRDPLQPERSDSYLKVFLGYRASPAKGWAIVGDFHTHPEAGGPDDWDIGLEFQRKVPGIVIDPDRTWVYGPNRGIWFTDLPSGCK